VKIAVLVRQVPDPIAVRFDPRGHDIQADTPQIPNEYDLYAVEAAIRLVESQGGEVVVAGVGPAKETLNRCLAMGADRAVTIDAGSPMIDTLGTATVLSAWIRGEQFDLILAGQETSDSGTGSVGPQVAALLDLPLISNVVDLEVAEEGLRLRREVEDGRQVVDVRLPAVLCALTGLAEPRYPSLKGIMAARRKPTESKSLSDLSLSASDLQPAVSWGGFSVEEETAEGVILRDTPSDAAVDQLVAFLQGRGIV
jgi:electron transfer flavoprotein beta subunit